LSDLNPDFKITNYSMSNNSKMVDVQDRAIGLVTMADQYKVVWSIERRQFQCP